MRYFAIFLLMIGFGCASLERDLGSDPIVDAGGPDGSLDPDVPDLMLDAGVSMPDAPDQCEPPPPPCECDEDCGRGKKCHWGKCYDRCGCDDDCSPGYGCIYGLCKKRDY